MSTRTVGLISIGQRASQSCRPVYGMIPPVPDTLEAPPSPRETSVASPRVVIQLALFAAHGPLIWLAQNSHNMPSIRSAATVTTAVLLAGFMLFWILVKLRVSVERSLAITSTVFVAFWHWPSLLLPIASLPAEVGAIAVTGLLLLMTHVLSPSGTFQRVMLAVGITLVTIPVLTFTYRFSSRGEISIPPSSGVVAIDSTSPFRDIHLVVFDGYARSDILKRTYAYDNTAFEEYLISKGFTVATEAKANYSITHFSLASMLEMAYLGEDGSNVSLKDLDELHRRMTGDNLLVRSLKEHGYRYVHAPHGWWGTECSEFVDSCLDSGELNQTSFEILNGSPLRHLLYSRTGDPGTGVALRRLEEFKAWPRTVAGAGNPILSLVHLSIPHPPLFLDRKCDLRVRPLLGGRLLNFAPSLPDEVVEDRKRAYVEQVECSNHLAQQLVSAVSPDDVIIFLSDHGPDSHGQLMLSPAQLTAAAHQERMGVLLAARLPRSCSGALEADVTLVNLMPVVLNCLFETEIETHAPRYFSAPTTSSESPIIEIADPDN